MYIFLYLLNYSIKERIPNAVFFFFSDDIDDVRAHFGYAEEYRYVHLPGGFTTDLIELYCMALCDHRIATIKSGYSQWAIQLNQNKEAMNLVFSETPNDKFIVLNKADIIDLLQKRTPQMVAQRNWNWDVDEKFLSANFEAQKQQIRSLMVAGQQKEARELILALEQYVPQDAEVAEWKQMFF